MDVFLFRNEYYWEKTITREALMHAEKIWLQLVL